MQSAAASILLQELGITSPYLLDYEVTEPVRKNKNHPDFDLLICNEQRPSESTALQVKRVKVRVDVLGNEKITKLDSVAQLVVQANIQRLEYGFHQNYLAIIMQSFGLNPNSQNIFFRGPSPATLDQIYNFPDRDKLHEDIGIIFIEITQPTNRSFNEKVGIGICADRIAQRLSQSENLTNRIRDHFL